MISSGDAHSGECLRPVLYVPQDSWRNIAIVLIDYSLRHQWRAHQSCFVNLTKIGGNQSPRP